MKKTKYILPYKGLYDASLFAVSYDNGSFVDTDIAKDIATNLSENFDRILTWFECKKVPFFYVILHNDYVDFIKAYSKVFGGKDAPSSIYSFLAPDGSIHILTYHETLEFTVNPGLNYDAYLDIAVYEFVGMVYSNMYLLKNKTMLYNHKWLKVGICSLLGCPENMKLKRLAVTLHQLTDGDLSISDHYYYTVARYLVKMLPHDKLLEYLFDIKLLDNDFPDLFEAMRRRSMNLK